MGHFLFFKGIESDLSDRPFNLLIQGTGESECFTGGPPILGRVRDGDALPQRCSEVGEG